MRNIIFKELNFANIQASNNDALKLFYFSLTTRQRTSNKPINTSTKRKIDRKIKKSLEILSDISTPVEKRYFDTMKELNEISGAGQKIITMFIKFLIIHSENLPSRRKLLKILWIPLDVHLIKFLYRRHNGNLTKRFKLFEKNVDQNKLKIEFHRDGTIKENYLYELQKEIKEKFKANNINKPPIILDNLWVIGSTRCVNKKFSNLISCQDCPFSIQFNENGILRNICRKEQ